MKTVSLPRALKYFLAMHEYALVSVASSDGAVLVAKMDRSEIETCSGRLPVQVRYEVHSAITGPAVRLLLEIHTPSDAPLVLETFFNPAETDQMDDLEDLLAREHLRILFFDEELEHRLSKKVTQPKNEQMPTIAPEARRLLAECDPSDLNFDRTKEAIMLYYPLLAE